MNNRSKKITWEPQIIVEKHKEFTVVRDEVNIDVQKYSPKIFQKEKIFGAKSIFNFLKEYQKKTKNISFKLKECKYTGGFSFIINQNKDIALDVIANTFSNLKILDETSNKILDLLPILSINRRKSF